MIEVDRPVLVTGLSGFAGSYTARALAAAGLQVVGMDLRLPQGETAFVLGDLADTLPVHQVSSESLPGLIDLVQNVRPTAIVHLASNMDVPFLDENPLLAVRGNVESALNVFEAARLCGVDRVVVTSTVAVMSQMLTEPISADHPVITRRTGPLGAYGAAKLAIEGFAFAYGQSFDLDVRIIRPSALYGFGMSWAAPNYVKQIIEPALMGQDVSLATGGEVPRDYVHVADLASLIAAAVLGPDDADRVYFAGTGRPLRTGGDVGRLVAAMVPQVSIEVASEWTPDDREEARMRGVLDVSSNREQLGWEPKYADLGDGLAEYADQFRAYLAAGGEPQGPPAGLRAPGI